jgi:hypothetical protein
MLIRFLPPLLLVFALCGCVTMRPHVPGATPIQVKGTYTHAPSGFIFPDRLGDFQRVSVDRYDSAGNDVGVGYNLELATSPVAFTLYVRPVGRAQDGSPASFEQHLKAELWVIDHYHPGARQIRREPVSTMQDGKSVPGEMVEFTYSEVFARRDQHVFSQLHLFAFDNWIVKYRITFPVSEEQRARAAVRNLLASLAWRAERAAAGDAKLRRA